MTDLTAWIVTADAAAEGGATVLELTGPEEWIGELSARFDDREIEGGDEDRPLQRVCATADEVIAELDGIDPEGLRTVVDAREATNFRTPTRAAFEAAFEAWFNGAGGEDALRAAWRAI